MEPRAGSFEVYLDWTGPDGANHTGLAPRTLLVCSRLPLVAFSLSPPISPSLRGVLCSARERAAFSVTAGGGLAANDGVLFPLCEKHKVWCQFWNAF